MEVLASIFGRRGGAAALACLATLPLAAFTAGCGGTSSSSATAPAASPVASRQADEAIALARSADPAGEVSPTAAAASAGDCPSAILDTLGGVARRVYAEAAGGRIVGQAAHRVASSAALLRAVQSGDVAGARSVLQSLMENQIVAVRVLRGSRTLAEVSRGHANAIAPVSEPLRDASGRTVGSYVVSVEGANGYISTLVGLIGARATVTSGSRVLASTLTPVPTHVPVRGSFSSGGVSYRVISFDVEAFPSGSVRVSLLVPSTAAAYCREGSHQPTPSEAATETIGAIAMRIYNGERSGGRPREMIRHVEQSRAFAEAVAGGNAAATRAAIIGFFRAHLHIVRVRVTRGSELLVDVGGPYVLAPASGTVRDASGKVVGHFQLAVQDDLGFLLLAHHFTGAEVFLREGSRQIMGTLRPGPASIPDRGRVVYAGKTYAAFSFTGEAFPSGPLRISLLVPTG